MQFWTTAPNFWFPLNKSTLDEDALLKNQINHLSSAILLDDYDPQVLVHSCKIKANTSFKFPAGSLLSGSSVMNDVSMNMGHGATAFDDIDIYFTSKDSAIEFLYINGINQSDFSDLNNPMCTYGNILGNKFNLIYGVEYDSPAHLISRFDIRACSMAIDINTNTLYAVDGAIEDTLSKRIAFNAVPRGCSIRRLVKYINKRFTISGQQSLFFSELVKSKLYCPELELLTKKY